ncbi:MULTISPECIES: PP2C family protein-serine/threonine phosphatase [Microbacterium]|uniref:PP2C family protein-serine/threonine phosphatase n=1 Tax=Microbacterium TaxID=33882 RepID=UPI00277D8D05|nr:MULTISPECIES: SpoIIE family protein phosphatase [Microbacterium]MDQ1082534.1 sigma-B regulation protein RsbU (phosphoserine phosphatase) [Microbacterium sp. SORGH_AS_0344]MDQ1168694.1 sigma-B regulation protein RsbU (phosphoserine phosphatase) [Microbacterium proteolyticum]
MFPAVHRSWEAVAKQGLVATLVVVAAVASAAVPWLLVTDPARMWQGVALALVLLAVSAAMGRWPMLRRWEIVVPLGDFLAIGLLRYGTGDSQSVFLAIIVLPVIWIAAGPGRWRVLVPLAGVCATLLLPIVLSEYRGITPSEFVRLLIAMLVYAAVGAVVNELSRRSLRKLTSSQDRRRIAEAEVTAAALVQRSLQPDDGSELPAAFRIAGACVPARTVGGDFFDWYPTPEGGAAFTLGDVMGKGVGAGMIAAAVRTVIRSSLDDIDPAAAFCRTAVGLRTGPADLIGTQFTTCFHARIDADGILSWVDAGHGLTVLKRADGSAEFLRSGHLPLGVGASWASSRTRLGPGDTLVSVSDGVLDLFGGSLDSVESYARFLDQHDDIDALVADLVDRAAAGEQEDDVTVLAVTWSPR